MHHRAGTGGVSKAVEEHRPDRGHRWDGARGRDGGRWRHGALAGNTVAGAAIVMASTAAATRMNDDDAPPGRSVPAGRVDRERLRRRPRLTKHGRLRWAPGAM